MTEPRQTLRDRGEVEDALRHGPLERVRIDGVDLEGLDATGARFIHCALSHVRFAGADLSSSAWVACELEDVDGTGANLSASRWVSCTLERALLEEADLACAQLEGVTASQVHLRGASLSALAALRTRLLMCDLTDVDARGIRLQECELVDVVLERARWSGARLEQVDDRGCIFDRRQVLGGEETCQWRSLRHLVDGNDVGIGARKKVPPARRDIIRSCSFRIEKDATVLAQFTAEQRQPPDAERSRFDHQRPHNDEFTVAPGGQHLQLHAALCARGPPDTGPPGRAPVETLEIGEVRPAAPLQLAPLVLHGPQVVCPVDAPDLERTVDFAGDTGAERSINAGNVHLFR